MERKEPWTFSEVSFRLCGTCVVLAATVGIGSCATKSDEGWALAGLLFAGAALTLIAGIIGAIWDQ